MSPASWPRVPWSLVHPGDRVYAADRHVWEVTARDGRLVTLAREGRRPVSRADPPGDVPCMRGRQWRMLAQAVRVLRGGGLTVELLGVYPIRDIDAGRSSG